MCWPFKGRRVKDHRRAALVLLVRRFGIQLVDLAAGQHSRVERAIRPQSHDLHGHILALKEREGLAVQTDGSTVAGEAVPTIRPPFRSRHSCPPPLTRRRSRAWFAHINQARPLGQMAVAGRSQPLAACLFQTPPGAIASTGACPGQVRAARSRPAQPQPARSCGEREGTRRRVLKEKVHYAVEFTKDRLNFRRLPAEITKDCRSFGRDEGYARTRDASLFSASITDTA
jgi:hypothetical protein